MAKQDLSPLVLAAQQGDEQALSDLLEASYRDLYFYAYQTVKNEDLAADITQESCLEIISTLSKLREPNAFVVWARRITYHQCTRHFRESKEITVEADEEGETVFDRIPDESEGALPEQVQLDKEFRATMQQLLDELPAQQRTALMLYYYEKLSVSQIAQIQDTTEGTVKSRLNYGRKAVKAKVEEYEKKTGVRLHSIAPLPLLLFFLFSKQGAEALASSSLGVIWQAISGSVAAGAGTAAGATAAAGTAAGAAGTATAGAAAGSAATAGAAAVGTGLGVKIATGVVAAAVCIGGAIGGTALIKNAATPSAIEIPPEFCGTWYGDTYAEGNLTDCYTLHVDGTLEIGGKTYSIFGITDFDENSVEGYPYAETFFLHATDGMISLNLTYNWNHQWYTPDYKASVDISNPDDHESQITSKTYSRKYDGMQLPAPHHPVNEFFATCGTWLLNEAAAAGYPSSYVVDESGILYYGSETYFLSYIRPCYTVMQGKAVFSHLEMTYSQDADKLHSWDRSEPDLLLKFSFRYAEDPEYSMQVIRPNSAAADDDILLGIYRLSREETPSQDETTPVSTEITEDGGISVPVQYLTHWKTFPDEDAISANCVPEQQGTFLIGGTAYYAVYVDPSAVYLSKDPSTLPQMSEFRLVYHADTFGIPAIEFQKLYPGDDKDPRTLDYFWRSADLEQLDAVTLTDDNWELFIDTTPGDQAGPREDIVINSNTYTYFHFKSFVSGDSRAEGSILRRSYLHRSYMIGTQGYIENIPGFEYLSDERIGLGGDAAYVGVPNLPDGATGGRGVEREVDGKTVVYYEQFTAFAELQNITGTVYIPHGFDAQAWYDASQ